MFPRKSFLSRFCLPLCNANDPVPSFVIKKKGGIQTPKRFSLSGRVTVVWIHAVEGWVYYLPSVSHPCLYSGHTTAWQQFLEERLYCTVEREKTFHKRRNSQILDLQSDRVFFLNREVLAVCLHGLEYRPLFIVWMKILFIHSLKNVVLQF